jgi:hypothetical protein
MKFLLSFVLLLIFTSAALSTAQATVCRLPGLTGYEAAAARAKDLLPSSTRNITELAVYIERGLDGSFYFHSNFKSAGFNEVTKIGDEAQLSDVERALQNIVWTELPSESQKDLVKTAYVQAAQIFVNRNVFREDGSTELEFGAKRT